MKNIVFLILIITCFTYAQWEEINDGLDGGTILSLIKKDGIIFAGTNRGLYTSLDNGINWTMKNDSLKVTNFKLLGNDIVAIANPRILLTTDLGVNWIEKFHDNETWITTIATEEKKIIIGTNNEGIYISTDRGENWSSVNNGLSELNITSLALSGEIIIAGTKTHGIFTSTNNGIDWKEKNEGLESKDITTIGINGENVFTATVDRIYRSKLNEIKWTKIFSGIDIFIVKCILFSGNDLYIGSNCEIALSTNNGDNWALLLGGCIDFNSLIIDKDTIYSSSVIGAIFSSDKGKKWELRNQGITDLEINDIEINQDDIFVGTSGFGVFNAKINTNQWISKNSGMKSTKSFFPFGINSIICNENNIYAMNDFHFYRSSDKGENWEMKDKGIDASKLMSIISKNERILIGTDEGLYLSTNMGDQWHQNNNIISGLTINSLAADNDNVFASSFHTGVYFSNSYGDTWEKKDYWINDSLITKLTINQGNIFARSSNGKIFMSTDYGNNWIDKNNGLADKINNSIIIYSNYIFVGSMNGGIYFSTNLGDSWNKLNSNLKDQIILSFAIKGDYIYCGTTHSIYRAKLSDFGITDVNLQKNNYYFALDCIPNPTENVVKLDFSVPNSCLVSIRISNSLGITIAEVMNQKYHTEGAYRQVFDASALPSGLYFCTLQTPECTLTKQFVVVK